MFRVKVIQSEISSFYQEATSCISSELTCFLKKLSDKWQFSDIKIPEFEQQIKDFDINIASNCFNSSIISAKYYFSKYNEHNYCFFDYESVTPILMVYNDKELSKEVVAYIGFSLHFLILGHPVEHLDEDVKSIFLLFGLDFNAL